MGNTAWMRASACCTAGISISVQNGKTDHFGEIYAWACRKMYLESKARLLYNEIHACTNK